MNGYRESRRRGQSLLEVLLGTALAALFMVGIATSLAPSLSIDRQVTQLQGQIGLANETINNVKAWANGNWQAVLLLATGTPNTYYVNASSSPFLTPTGTESISLGSTTFSRYFYLSDVYRDINGNITSTAAGNFYDPSTKQVSVVISSSSSVSARTYVIYVTRYVNNTLNQTSWSGGQGQIDPLGVIGNNFATSTKITINASGSIQLASSGTNYVASGTLDSATFNTGVASGTQLNSITWQGSVQSNASVSFQFAMSNATSGPWNYEGPDGTANVSFAATAGTPTTLVGTNSGYALLNGYQYFRYRTILFSDSSSTYTPIVTQVTINWSP